MKNLISVIIPAHNEEAYIEKTIKSILDNKINYELIIICDSCSDNTHDIAKKYTKKVYDVGFENISKTRNYGAKKSKGEILVFIDADTIITQNYLQEIKEVLKDFDYGVAKWKSESGSFFGEWVAWNNNIYTKFHKVVNGNFFVKRKYFDKMGGFDESMLKGEDTDLGERLKKNGAKFVYLKNIRQIPSERKYKNEGFLRRICNTQKEGFLYFINKSKYKEKFGSK